MQVLLFAFPNEYSSQRNPQNTENNERNMSIVSRVLCHISYPFRFHRYKDRRLHALLYKVFCMHMFMYNYIRMWKMLHKGGLKVLSSVCG